MNDVAGFGLAYLLFMLLGILIFVALLRWALRINHIVARLDKIVGKLDDIINSGVEVEKASEGTLLKRPKSFMDGIRKGMAE